MATELSNLFVIVSEQLLEFNLALMNYCVQIKYVSLIPYETFVLIYSLLINDGIRNCSGL